MLKIEEVDVISEDVERCPSCNLPFNDGGRQQMDDDGDCLSCLQMRADARHDRAMEGDLP